MIASIMGGGGGGGGGRKNNIKTQKLTKSVFKI